MADPRFDLAHRRGNRGAFRVCVLDTGLMETVGTHALHDFTGTGIRRDVHHGTRMARIVQAVCPDAWLYFGKVVGGADPWGDLADGIRWAIASDVDAISISLAVYLTAGQTPHPEVGNAIADALDDGIGVFAGGGNTRGATSAPAPAGFHGVCRCSSDGLIFPWSTATWPVPTSSEATAGVVGAYGLWLASDNNVSGTRNRYLVDDPYRHWLLSDLAVLKDRHGTPYCGNL